VPFATGAPENPISDEDLVAKALSLLVPVLGTARAQQVVDTVWALERCADFAELTRLLAAPAEA
jgi:hypothetical protein